MEPAPTSNIVEVAPMDIDEHADESQANDAAPQADPQSEEEESGKVAGRASSRIQNFAKTGKLKSLEEKHLSRQPKGTRSQS